MEDLLQASDVGALVISGPSGVGKGSIIQCLLRQLGSRVALCIRSPPSRPRPLASLEHACEMG